MTANKPLFGDSEKCQGDEHIRPSGSPATIIALRALQGQWTGALAVEGLTAEHCWAAVVDASAVWMERWGGTLRREDNDLRVSRRPNRLRDKPSVAPYNQSYSGRTARAC